MTGSTDEETDRSAERPGRLSRVGFWLALAIFSTFFAEVTCANQPYAFFSVDLWLLMVPIYGLHAVVIAGAIWRFGRPGRAALYLGGMLFGMYEAYMTKVIWAGWNANEVPFKIGEIAVFQTAVLVLFYHAVMAFLIPLLMTERLLLDSDAVWRQFPPRVVAWRRSRIAIMLLGAACGAFQGATFGANMGALGLTGCLASTVGCATVVLLTVLLWRNAVSRPWNWEDLMPDRREWIGLSALLLGYYVFAGVAFHPENWPGWQGHVVVLLMYAALLLLFVRALRRREAPARGSTTPAPEAYSGVRDWLRFTVVYIGVSTAVCALTLRLPVPGVLFAGLVLLAGIAFGAYCFFRSARFALGSGEVREDA